MKIGMYTDDEILEHLTNGEGRAFLGRSMYDAIMQELQRKDNIINELKKALKDHKEIKNKTNTKEYYIEVDEVLDKITELENEKK